MKLYHSFLFLSSMTLASDSFSPLTTSIQIFNNSKEYEIRLLENGNEYTILSKNKDYQLAGIKIPITFSTFKKEQDRSSIIASFNVCACNPIASQNEAIECSETKFLLTLIGYKHINNWDDILQKNKLSIALKFENKNVIEWHSTLDFVRNGTFFMTMEEVFENYGI